MFRDHRHLHDERILLRNVIILYIERRVYRYVPTSFFRLSVLNIAEEKKSKLYSFSTT